MVVVDGWEIPNWSPEIPLIFQVVSFIRRIDFLKKLLNIPNCAEIIKPHLIILVKT